MEHINNEGIYRERKIARWSTSRRRGDIGREREREGAQQEGEIQGEKESEMEHNKKYGRYRERKRARWSTSRSRGDIGRERERDGAQQEVGEI